MNTKTLITAAILASLPAMSSAMFLSIDDGGSTTIDGTNETIFTFDVDPQNPTNSFEHTFTLTNAGSGDAEVSLTTSIAGAFTGLVAQWLDTNGTVLADADVGPGVTTLSTVFADPGSLTQTLSINWKSVDPTLTDEFDGEVRISTVPVPAGLLLMGTALAGLGLTRRKKA